LLAHAFLMAAKRLRASLYTFSFAKLIFLWALRWRTKFPKWNVKRIEVWLRLVAGLASPLEFKDPIVKLWGFKWNRIEPVSHRFQDRGRSTFRCKMNREKFMKKSGNVETCPNDNKIWNLTIPLSLLSPSLFLKY